MAEEETVETPGGAPPQAAAFVVLPLLAGMGAVYLEGLPNKLANPLYILGVLVLFGRGFSSAEAVRLGLPLALAGLCFSLVAADIGVRILLPGKVHFRPLERLMGRHPRYPELVRFTPSSRVVMDTFGDIAAASPDASLRQPRRVEFQTDELGFRNPPGSSREPLDAIALGDSFTLGHGCSQADMWVRVLEQGRGKRVYDLAYPTDPAGELLLLKATLPSLQLKPGTTVIWSLFEGNDFRPTGHSDLNLPEPDGWLGQLQNRLAVYRNRSPIRIFLRRLDASKKTVYSRRLQVGKETEGGKVLFFQEYLDEVAKNPGEGDEGLAAVTRALQEMVRFTNEQQLRLVVLGLPVKARVYPELLPDGHPLPSEPSPYLEHLRLVCTAEGVDFLDVTELFRQAKPLGPFLWWRDDSHWNQAGNKLYAQIVGETVWGAGE